MKRCLFLMALLVGSAPFGFAQEKLPPGAKVTKVEVTPARIELKSPFEYRQLLVTGILSNGDRVDLTRMTEFTTPKAVKTSEFGQVRPVADGAGELKYAVQGQKGSIPVKVSGQKKIPAISFVRDVQPVLARIGCNAGTCHGSAQGRNGFQLSLRGYDPI
jgi:hypothetical protein